MNTIVVVNHQTIWLEMVKWGFHFDHYYRKLPCITTQGWGPCWWWFVCFLFVCETRQKTTAICIPICNSGKWKKQLIDLGSTWWLIILLEVNWAHNVLIPTISWRIELLWRLRTITPRLADKYWFDGQWSKEWSVFLSQLLPVWLMRTTLCLILTFRGGDEGNSNYWQKETICEIEYLLPSP